MLRTRADLLKNGDELAIYEIIQKGLHLGHKSYLLFSTLDKPYYKPCFGIFSVSEVKAVLWQSATKLLESTLI